MKLRSISAKISLVFGILMIVLCLGLVIVAYITASNALKESNDSSLIEIAHANAHVIEHRMEAQVNALEALAENQWLKTYELTLEQKLELLRAEEQRSGHLYMLIADPEGNAKLTNGQTLNIALPLILLNSTNPKVLLSLLFSLLSPRTKTVSGGTSTGKPITFSYVIPLI